MDLLLAFLIFVGTMVGALVVGYSMVIPLLVGLVAFVLVGVHRGYRLPQLYQMGKTGAKDSLIVIEVMCLIGFITAIWRISGTITVFVYYGMKFITPSLFLIIAFLLSCILSYAIGTSFGVAGTVGVIFMTLARSGGVDPIVTAGVLMSGVYFGDRGSPISSSANMVAGITGTKIFDNVRVMMKTAIVPMLICLGFYAFLSVRNPISHVDASLMKSFEDTFQISYWAFLPAALMLVLPLFRVDVMWSMLLSIISGIGVAIWVQGVPFMTVVKVCLLGYHPEGEGLAKILEGGGLSSMVEIIIILLISCTYSGIFNETGMLSSLQKKLEQACTKIGRFGVMLLLSLASAMVFCNQTIATLMCNDLLHKPYEEGGATKTELAQDMENSVILIACFVPWSIGCSVPLSFFGVGIECLPYALFMYLMPVFYLLTKKLWFPEKTKGE